MTQATAVAEQPRRGPSAFRTLMTSLTGVVVARLALLAALLALWEFGVSQKMQFWTSTPSVIASTLYGWVVDGTLWTHLGATLTAMAVGYMIGCATGVAAGLILGFFPRVARVLSPYVSAFYALPKIALAPLFVILFGIGIESKVALVAITVFFLLFNSTLDGFRDIDSGLIVALRLMGATGGETARKVVLPATLPWIFSGMRIAVRYAFTATLLAELIASNRGLGFLIERSSGDFDTAGAYAAIVVLVVFSVALTEVLNYAEGRLDYRTRH